MYLLTIHRLTRRQPMASTTSIAARLHISQPSVTEQLKRLYQQGYINYEWREGASLTETGQRVALGVLRKHRLLETFLVECFGYGLDEVHEEACRLEHQISNRLADEIEKSWVIPTLTRTVTLSRANTANWLKEIASPLTAIMVGQSGIVGEISDADIAPLGYLLKHGVTPGTCLTIIEVVPQQGPLMVRVKDKMIALTYALAQEVYVCDCFD